MSSESFKIEAIATSYVTVDEFIKLVDTVGRELALKYIGYRAGRCDSCLFSAPGLSSTFVQDHPLSSCSKESGTLATNSQLSVVDDLPSGLATSSTDSMRSSLEFKSHQQLKMYRKRSGYCYTEIIADSSYFDRIKIMRSWPNIVTILRTPYADTVGLDVMKQFSLRSVDGLGRYHLTTDTTGLPFLDALYTLSQDYRQRAGTLGYHLSVANICEVVSLPDDFSFASKLGGLEDDRFERIKDWLGFTADAYTSSFIFAEYERSANADLAMLKSVFSSSIVSCKGSSFTSMGSVTYILAKVKSNELESFVNTIYSSSSMCAQSFGFRLRRIFVSSEVPFVFGNFDRVNFDVLVCITSTPLNRFSGFSSLGEIHEKCLEVLDFAAIPSSDGGCVFIVVQNKGDSHTTKLRLELLRFFLTVEVIKIFNCSDYVESSLVSSVSDNDTSSYNNRSTGFNRLQFSSSLR